MPQSLNLSISQSLKHRTTASNDPDMSVHRKGRSKEMSILKTEKGAKSKEMSILKTEKGIERDEYIRRCEVRIIRRTYRPPFRTTTTPGPPRTRRTWVTRSRNPPRPATGLVPVGSSGRFRCCLSPPQRRGSSGSRPPKWRCGKGQ